MTNYEEYIEHLNKLNSFKEVTFEDYAKYLYLEVADISEKKMSLSTAVEDFHKRVRKSKKGFDKHIHKRKKLVERYKKSKEALELLLYQLRKIGFESVKNGSDYKEISNDELRIILIIKEIDNEYYLINNEGQSIEIEDALNMVSQVILEVIAENKFKPYRRV